MRLIDADAVKRILAGSRFKYIRNFLNKQPTIDAVPVVRCKDCKYRSGLFGTAPFMFCICTCAEGLSGAVRDNNFCSYGERKEQTCETCKYNDMKPEDVGNPCWNCKGEDNSEWERKDGDV